MKDELPLNIIIAGVGGQGTILASYLTAFTAVRKGYFSVVGETFGASQRGGPVMSHVRIGERELGPLVPLRRAHIILGFEPIETVRVGTRYLNQESSVIMNLQPIHPVEVLAGILKYPEVDKVVAKMRKLAKNVWTLQARDLAIKAGNAITVNIVMVGALAGSGLTPFKENDFRETVVAEIRSHKEANLKAFDLGLEWIKCTQSF